MYNQRPKVGTGRPKLPFKRRWRMARAIGPRRRQRAKGVLCCKPLRELSWVPHLTILQYWPTTPFFDDYIHYFLLVSTPVLSRSSYTGAAREGGCTMMT